MQFDSITQQAQLKIAEVEGQKLGIEKALAQYERDNQKLEMELRSFQDEITSVKQ